MTLARLAQLAIVCATMAFSVGKAAADPPSHDVSPALIGLAPAAQTAPPPPKHRKLWIAIGVVSAAAAVGAIVAVGVTFGTAAHDNSVFNDWGTLTVTRR
jgi:negative regulator of sigma E activity